jgi:hypothetical protein
MELAVKQVSKLGAMTVDASVATVVCWCLLHHRGLCDTYYIAPFQAP